ncbi:MAG: DUF1684 domain-containing protein [Anaerolineales bacterium]|nr:DUF1684 domain-containing protein [Anaerolineales bacterium]
MADKTYEQEILKWRAEKYEALTGENGWVALAGLYDLKEGRNLVGSTTMSEVVLPEHAPTYLGVVDVSGKTIRFQPANGINVKVNGRAVQKIALKTAQDPKPSFITWNQIRMAVHKHGEKYSLRIWDNDRAERFNLPPLKWFSINKKLKFNATYTRYPKPKISPQGDSTGDVIEEQLTGFVSFRFEGKTYKLDVSETKTKKLFVKFRDGTSQKESYPPSRYLYTEKPKNGKVTLDFNYSYSPPCAFTPYATCVFAPPQNTLPFRVEAGEIYRG